MTRRRLAPLALVPWAFLSCDKGTETTPPEPVAAAETTPAGEADDGGVEEPGDEASDDGDGDDGATEPEPAGDDGGGQEASASDDGGEPEPEPLADAGGSDGDGDGDGGESEGGGDLELPKPVYAKVKASCGKDPGVGEKLKNFKLPSTTEGKTISNGTYRGRVMLVNFWGTWCKPCLKELPKFAQLYRRYRKHGMTLLAIATDEDREAVVDTLSKKKIAAKVAIAGEEYAGQYSSPQFPFTFVVDHQGVIQASYFGYEPDCMGKLEADLREQLEKRAKAKK